MKAKQFFFIMIGVLIISLASIVGSFYLGNQRLQAESARIGDLLATRDVTQEKIIRLQKAQKDAEQLETVVSLLDRLLPKEKEQDKLIADIIYTATAEAGIPFSKVTSFSFSGSGEPDDLSGTEPFREVPGVYEYPFTLQIDTISYETLLNLLKEIESNGRIVQVENLQISPDPTNPNIVTVNLSTKAYVRP